MAATVDQKLLRATKFPPEFNQKVDFEKVNSQIIKKWIAGKISEILGSEDDVVIELCFNLIESSRYPDIKKIQIQLTGFLDKDTASFCKELWNLCLSAQSNPQGVPKELLEAKKLELIQEKLDAEKAVEDGRKRRDEEQGRERDIGHIRDRERGERDGDRGRGRGRGRGDSWRGRGRGDRGGKGSRDYDERPRRGSRSPPRRRDSRERDSFRPPPPRDTDTYIPSHRNERRRPSTASESRSLSATNSPSRSRSPVRRRATSSSRSLSRSPPRRSYTPERRIDTYRGRGGRRGGRGRSPDRRPRRRSPSPSSSRSRSPRPSRRRRSTVSLSRSPSPRSRRRTTTSSRSVSRSRSRGQTPRRRVSWARERNGTTPTPDSDAEMSGTRPQSRRREHERRRLTRDSRSPVRRRHSRSRSPRRDGGGGRGQKRRGSIQRYEPANKKRRNTSSEPDERPEREADSARIDRSAPRREPEASNSAEPVDSNETMDPKKQASHLKEKLLREKIKKMRTSSIDSKNAQANKI